MNFISNCPCLSHINCIHDEEPIFPDSHYFEAMKFNRSAYEVAKTNLELVSSFVDAKKQLMDAFGPVDHYDEYTEFSKQKGIIIQNMAELNLSYFKILEKTLNK